MDFFGLTSYGYSDYFKAFKRDDFIEPKKSKPCLDLESKENQGKKLVDILHNLDCYIQNDDGYAHSSYDRMQRQRQKGTVKPVGPCQMYMQPMTTAQEIGFWNCDSNLEGKEWCTPEKCNPIVWSPITRFMEMARRNDKNLLT